MDKTDRARRRVRFHHLAVVGIAVALLAGPIAAFAADDFPDVPNDHPFHDEIGWLAGTGITTGFPDGTFKPGQAVTRQSMAAFMQRFYNLEAGLTDVAFGTDGGASDDEDAEATWTTIATTTVTVPEGTTGMIVSTFSGDGICNGGTNIFGFLFAVRPQCMGRITVQGSGISIPVAANPGPVALLDSDDAALDPDNLFDTEGFSMTASSVSESLSPGTWTVRAQINHDDSNDTDDENNTFDIGSYLLVSTVHLNDAA